MSKTYTNTQLLNHAEKAVDEASINPKTEPLQFAIVCALLVGARAVLALARGEVSNNQEHLVK